MEWDLKDLAQLGMRNLPNAKPDGQSWRFSESVYDYDNSHLVDIFFHFERDWKKIEEELVVSKIPLNEKQQETLLFLETLRGELRLRYQDLVESAVNRDSKACLNAYLEIKRERGEKPIHPFLLSLSKSRLLDLFHIGDSTGVVLPEPRDRLGTAEYIIGKILTSSKMPVNELFRNKASLNQINYE